MGHTEQSTQEAINKILSFTYEELENWIRSRLHGDDEYFSIYEGHETNLRGFLTDAFHHIKNKTFRDCPPAAIRSGQNKMSWFQMVRLY